VWPAEVSSGVAVKEPDKIILLEILFIPIFKIIVMTRMNITAFYGYDCASLNEYISLQDSPEIEIIIPRCNFSGGDEAFDILFDFQEAAYAGHELSMVSSGFAYYVPMPSGEEAFRFEICVADIDVLACVLYRIIQAYAQKGRADHNCLFEEAASKFYINSYDQKIIPHTWGLLAIADDYLTLLG
jgi:hypothetical protein